MAEPKVEPVGNGLVTSRDASLLEPGELTVANDVILKPGSPSLHKAPGRTLFNSTPLTAATGIGYANFETANDKLVVVDSAEYKTATAAMTGTFASLGTGDAGSSLEVVVLDDRAVLLSGPTTSNRVLLNDGSSRVQGLLPVPDAPGAVVTSSGGVWPYGATGLGYYEYWAVEVYMVGEGEAAGQEEVEGTFTGTPATVNITTTTSYVTLTAPDIINPSATHWRIYISERKTNIDDQAFPLGWRIATVPISQRTFTHGLATTGSDTTVAVGGVTATTTVEITQPGWQITVNAWNNPANARTNDGSTATSASVSFSGVAKTISQLQYTNFGFTNITAPVTNIRVTVEGSRSVSTVLTAYLSWDGGAHWTNGKNVALGTSNGTVIVDGGDWGRTWSSTEFADGTFMLLLIASGNSVAGTITLDFASVALTYNSATAAQVDTFPFVSLRVSNTLTPIGSNGHPAPATTGCVYQNSLLMNSTANPTAVQWTIPGTIDYVPVLYELVVGDVVKCIRAIGSTAVIGCAGRKYRMNFLPVAEDPEFNVGRCLEPIDEDDGVVSGKGMVSFLLNGEPTLFCVGGNSLKITNGYRITTATDDIIWTDLVNTSALSACKVENNAFHHEILVYYPDTSSTTANKVLRLSYHPTHLKNGKLKVSGITNYAAKDAVVGTVSTGERRLYSLKSNGTTVYVENQGYADASDTGIVPEFETREAHLAGIGNSWEAVMYGIHHQGGGGDVSVGATSILANYPEESASPKTLTLTDRMLSVVENKMAGDGIKVSVTGEDDDLPLTIDYVVFFAEGLGETAPLKA